MSPIQLIDMIVEDTSHGEDEHFKDFSTACAVIDFPIVDEAVHFNAQLSCNVAKTTTASNLTAFLAAEKR